MKYNLILMVLLCYSAVGTAQLKVEKVYRKQNAYNRMTSSFPVFWVSEDSKVSNAVNQFLQMNRLGLLVGKEKEHVFEKDWPQEDRFHGRQSVDYRIIENNKAFLSVELNEEFMGAYSSYSTDHENFDLRNGEVVYLPDLFTVDGYEIFKKMINNERKLSLQAAIASSYQGISEILKEIQASNDESLIESLKSDLEDSYDEVSIYEDCIKTIEEYSFSKEFCLKKEELVVYRGRCSNHALRALDAIGDFENTMKYSLIKPLLSKYGLNLLFDEKPGDFETHYSEKIFYGHIAEKYPITLVLDKYSDEYVSGVYLYNNIGRTIHLSGEAKGNGLVLSVYNENDDNTGEFSLTVSDDNKSIVGVWTNTEGKSLKVELKRRGK
ncbi:hypothetical protein DF185_06400 [Marinifilum breve]|uniref:Lumazine-binding domain-containing protein n=1 Tax=Marinifilum breve TaxID=2184082 RepID=A0A2V4ADZ0_9BACT|nr:hypothetical protein [Marinifilum breve]PXY02274.1 hypothetical protein DF185_06400 [Marinifilum breve]